MAQNGEDDFWNKKSDDDFWNKSVIPDNWYNNSTEQEASKPSEKEFILSDIAYYTEEKPLETKAPSKKGISAHLVIRLIFISFTVLAGAFFIIYAQFHKKVIDKIVSTISYTEKEVAQEYTLSNGSRLIMPQSCYTFWEEESQIGIPEGEKLISVYVQFLEATNTSNDRRRFDYYVCYETPEGLAYRRSLQPDNCYPFLYQRGIMKRQLLYPTIISASYDTKGYVSFFVPAQVTDIWFYVEEKKEKYQIDVVACLYKKKLHVLSKEQTALEALPVEE